MDQSERQESERGREERVAYERASAAEVLIGLPYQ